MKETIFSKKVLQDLSRLGRSVLLISYLQTNQANFVFAESPNDDYMVHQMKAVIAEDEGRKITIRTKQAQVKREKA